MSPGIAARYRGSQTAGTGSGFRRLDGFHQDAAHLEEAMNRREPQLRLPGESHFVAGSLEFLAIISAALPGAADKRAGNRVLGRQNQGTAAGPQHAADLTQTGTRIGQVFDHPAARHTIKHSVGKGHPHHVSRDITGPRVFDAAARAAEHLVRQVERAQLCIGARLFQEMAQDLSRSGADVENPPPAA